MQCNFLGIYRDKAGAYPLLSFIDLPLRGVVTEYCILVAMGNIYIYLEGLCMHLIEQLHYKKNSKNARDVVIASLLIVTGTSLTYPVMVFRGLEEHW